MSREIRRDDCHVQRMRRSRAVSSRGHMFLSAALNGCPIQNRASKIGRRAKLSFLFGRFALFKNLFFACPSVLAGKALMFELRQGGTELRRFKSARERGQAPPCGDRKFLDFLRA